MVFTLLNFIHGALYLIDEMRNCKYKCYYNGHFMFETSESTVKLDAAICAVQKELKHAKFDSTNPHYKSKFASFGAVVDSCRDLLTKNGISLTQWCVHNDDGKLHLVTRVALNGEWMLGEMSIPVTQQTPQQYGAATTYAKRFALAACLGIVADEDDDGNSANAVKPAGSKTTPPPRVDPTPSGNANTQRKLSPEPPSSPATHELTPIDGPLPRKPKHLSDAQIKRLHAIKAKSGWDNARLKEFILTRWKTDTTFDLTAVQYDNLCAYMEQNVTTTKETQ